MNSKKKQSMLVAGFLLLISLLLPNASATELTNSVSTPIGSITINNNYYGEQFRVTVEGQFSDLPDGKAFVLCLIGRNPSLPKSESEECYGFIHRNDRGFRGVFNLPEKYQLEASARLIDSSIIFTSTQTSDVVFATLLNKNYICQKQKSCKKPKPEPDVEKTINSVSNASRYVDGYKLINQPPAKLDALGFYGYFSANKRITNANAAKFCKYFVRQSSLRSNYFDSFSSRELQTFLQGCVAAAIKIPYGK